MSRQPILAEGRPHAASRPPSRYVYLRYGCRCDECRSAHRDYVRAQVADRRVRLADEFDSLPHGSVSTYSNWGCRCAPCVEAMSEKNKRAHARRKAGRPMT